MEGSHDLPRLRQHLIDYGGVAGEAVYRHHLDVLPEVGGAFLQLCAQDFRATPRAHVQQAGGPEPRKVDTLGAGLGAFRTGVADGHRCGIDDGDVSSIGGTGDRQSDLGGPADGVGHEVATRMHSRVLVRLDESVVTLILYRPGPLHVVPPRTPPRGQLRTPKREDPVYSGPMDFLDVGRIIVGLVLLVVGGELLVRGASALARRVGISSLVVGLTVVSAATSAPELAITIGAVWQDEPGLAVGNVVGSNIINILFILGLSALILPLVVTRGLVRFDVPVMVVLSAGLLVMALDGVISAIDGVILFSAVVAHTVWTIVASRRSARPPVDSTETTAASDTGDGDEKTPATSTLKSLLLIVVGIALLVGGATLLVDGAVNIATGLGISSLVVGLTVVAIGTSLPELVTSITAVRRGERDIAVGNIVGSNIFNIGVVLGLPALISLDGIPVSSAAIAFDIPVMLAVAAALLPIVFTGFVVARWEGAVFLGLYVAYTGYLVLAATEHDALKGFTAVMAGFILPLVIVTLIAFTSYEIGLRKGRKDLARTDPS